MTPLEMIGLLFAARKEVQQDGLYTDEGDVNVYRVIGFDVDPDEGVARIRYQRIAGPGYDQNMEAGIIMSRPFTDWNFKLGGIS